MNQDDHRSGSGFDGVNNQILIGHVCRRLHRTLAGSLESGPLELDAAAKQLYMSPRTLQRRLAEEGSTFRDVLDSLRRDVALEHLRHKDLAIAEVAHLTGFSEVTIAVNNAVHLMNPRARVNPGHSTNLAIFKDM